MSATDRALVIAGHLLLTCLAFIGAMAAWSLGAVAYVWIVNFDITPQHRKVLSIVLSAFGGVAVLQLLLDLLPASWNRALAHLLGLAFGGLIVTNCVTWRLPVLDWPPYLLGAPVVWITLLILERLRNAPEGP